MKVVLMGLAATLVAVPAAAQYPACPPAYQPAAVVQRVVAADVTPLYVTVPVESQAIAVQAYGVPYYYSVGDAYREKAYLREVIREELRSAGGQAQGVQAPRPVGVQPQYQQQPPQAPQGVQQPQQPQQASQPVPDDATPPDLQQKVLAGYNESGCLSCHGPGPNASGAKGKSFSLVTDDGRLLKKSADKRWKIYGMASVGAMPPSAANDASKAMKSAHLPALLQYASIKD